MFGQKKDKEEKSKLGDTPKSPSIVRSGAKLDKWKVEEQRKADKMAKKALEEEEDSFSLPLAVRQLEYCPPPTRRHTQFLLSGYLAVKTSGGWTRKWQTRFCVLTPTAIYVYKRPPPSTDGGYGSGPDINAIQSSSVVSGGSNLEKEKALSNDETITPQRLAKIMATADTTDDGSHELFGLIRDSIPIEAGTIIMEVPQLPNTFCLTFPDCPRLLVRASNYEQYKLWMYTIQSTIILRQTPPHMISSVLAKRPTDETNDLLHLVPHLEQLLPLFTDRVAIINSISLHNNNQSLYTDASLINTDQSATNVQSPSEANSSATLQPNLKDIVNSTTLNNQILATGQVNLNVTPSQGNIITNLTPWGQKVNIVMNQLVQNVSTVPGLQLSPAQLLDQNSKDNSITIQLGDGGFITIPIETLYELYLKRGIKSTPTSTVVTPSSSPTPAGIVSPTSFVDGTSDVSFTEQYADALFTVSNSLYNADIHLGFKFSTLPSGRKDINTNKAKKLTAKQQAQIRQQQEQALEEIRKNATPPINSIGALLALAVSAYIVYNVHNLFPQNEFSDTITVWLTYLVLTLFTIKMANVTFKSSQRRQSLANDRDAITKMVQLSGFQQTQLNAASSSAQQPTTPSQDLIPILEIVPIRLIDRHTITGAVLLAGAKFDDDVFPTLPLRITLIPQISLLKALQSSTSLNKSIGNGFNAVGNLQLDATDLDGSTNNETNDSDDEAVYETDPILGKVYVECWGKWCQSDYRGLHLRGPDYLTNKKKIKIPALPHRFQVCHTNIVEMKESQPHCARWVNSYFRKQRQKAIELGKGDLWKKGTPLKYLIVNHLVPGTPNYNMIMYFRNPYIYPSPYPDDIARGHQQEYHPSSPNKIAVVYPNETEGSPDPLARLIEDFCTKDDSYRKSRFKYIPSVAEGAWFVRKTVGQTPVILGNKLTQFYFNDPQGQYVEVDVDVSSSSVAGSILGVVKGYAKNLAIDLNYLLEPHEPDELPEALWGGCRIINIDLFNVEHFDVVHGPADD
jgi:hypothetical protein